MSGMNHERLPSYAFVFTKGRERGRLSIAHLKCPPGVAVMTTDHCSSNQEKRNFYPQAVSHEHTAPPVPPSCLASQVWTFPRPEYTLHPSPPLTSSNLVDAPTKSTKESDAGHRRHNKHPTGLGEQLSALRCNTQVRDLSCYYNPGLPKPAI